MPSLIVMPQPPQCQSRVGANDAADGGDAAAAGKGRGEEIVAAPGRDRGQIGGGKAEDEAGVIFQRGEAVAGLKAQGCGVDVLCRERVQKGFDPSCRVNDFFISACDTFDVVHGCGRGGPDRHQRHQAGRLRRISTGAFQPLRQEGQDVLRFRAGF